VDEVTGWGLVYLDGDISLEQRVELWLTLSEANSDGLSVHDSPAGTNIGGN